MTPSLTHPAPLAAPEAGHVHAGLRLTPELFRALVRAAAEACGNDPRLVVRNDIRTRPCARARGLVCMVLRDNLGVPWSGVAAYFGRSTHSSLCETTARVRSDVRRRAPWVTVNHEIAADQALTRVEAVLAREVAAKSEERGAKSAGIRPQSPTPNPQSPSPGAGVTHG